MFAAIAPIAAFFNGGEWLDALRTYLWENRTIAEEYIKREIQSISPVSAVAAYLLWLDCRNVIGSSTELCHYAGCFL